MRRLLHLLTMSIMISGLLFFGATSAFADPAQDVLEGVNVDTLVGEGEDPLLGEGGVEGLLCSLLGEEGLVPLLTCADDEVPGGGGGQPAPVPVTPVGSTGDVGGGDQVSSVPSGGVAAGGGTTPVGATALIGTLLAMAAVGTGLGRALARS